MPPKTERALDPNISETDLVNRSGLRLAFLPIQNLRTCERSSPRSCGSVEWMTSSKVNPVSSSSFILSMKDSSHTLGTRPHFRASAALRSVKRTRREKERERRTSQYDSSISYFLLNLRTAGLL